MRFQPADNRIEIPLHKTKLIFTLIGAAAFVVIGVVFIVSPETFADTGTRRRPVELVLGIGLVSVLFFSLCAVFIALRILDKRPGIIIQEEGIVINNAAWSTFIKWDEIIDLGERRVKSTRFLMIYLADPEAYISKETKWFRRTLMSVNYKGYGSPVSVTANGLKCNFNELHSLIEARINK